MSIKKAARDVQSARAARAFAAHRYYAEGQQGLHLSALLAAESALAEAYEQQRKVHLAKLVKTT